MKRYSLRSIFAASAICFTVFPAVAQTTLGQGTVTNIPNNAIFVNPTGQDTFVTGGANQSVNQAPNANAAATARGGRGGTGGNAVVTNNNTITGLPGGAGVGGYPSTLRNTPSATLALATAYCQNNAGVSGSGPGFSFGIAGGKHDTDCIRQNYAMLLSSLGMTQEALLVISNNKEVNEALWEAHRQREKVAAQPATARVVAINPAGPRDPAPSDRDCATFRQAKNLRQIQRDYFAANCR